MSEGPRWENNYEGAVFVGRFEELDVWVNTKRDEVTLRFDGDPGKFYAGNLETKDNWFDPHMTPQMPHDHPYLYQAYGMAFNFLKDPSVSPHAR